MGFIGSIVIGLIAGYVASRLTSGKGKGFWMNLILGLVGSLVGGWVFNLLGIDWGGLIGQLCTSIVGAILILWLASKVK